MRARIPDGDAEALAELEAEMSADRDEVLRRLSRQGLEDRRRERTPDGLRNHEFTFRKTAERADRSYVEMVTLPSEEGIDVDHSIVDHLEDVDRV